MCAGSKGRLSPTQVGQFLASLRGTAVDDFEEVYLRLKNSAVSFESEPYKASGNTVVFFKDPTETFYT
jgi:hypothetical protein